MVVTKVIYILFIILPLIGVGLIDIINLFEFETPWRFLPLGLVIPSLYFSVQSVLNVQTLKTALAECFGTLLGTIILFLLSTQLESFQGYTGLDAVFFILVFFFPISFLIVKAFVLFQSKK